MKTIILSLTIIFSFLFCSYGLFSQNIDNKITLDLRHEKPLLIEDKIYHKAGINVTPVTFAKFSAEDLKYESVFSYADSNIQKTKKKKKSVGLGILFSALVPGAGELYGGDYLRAGIFFGIEVLAWGTYIYFNNKGNDAEEEFQQFADANWDVTRYARWLNDEFDAGVDPNAEKEELRRQINEFESTHFSHTLPPYGSQQYYELIGKYQNFMGGWADAENSSGWIVTSANYFTYKTPMFLGYADDRQEANDFYDYAKIGPITAILNHILSAADAAWVISSYNNKIKLETGFRINNMLSPYTHKVEQIPTFNMRVSF